MFFNLSINKFTFGISPSLPRQQFKDITNDWEFYSLNNRTNCSAIKNIPSPDIEAITYLSDGKLLNATMWLDGPLNEGVDNSEGLLQMRGYLVGIIVISTFESDTFDYMFNLRSGPISSQWDPRAEEQSSNDTRFLEWYPNWSFDHNSSNVLPGLKGKGHVNLSLDLEKINFPNQYVLLFGTYFASLDPPLGGCIFVDFADNAAYIPPPEFDISTSPNPVIMSPGEEKRINLTINSSIAAAPQLSLSTSSPKGLSLNFDPGTQTMDAAGITTSYLTAKVLQDASYDQTYTIPVMAEISFPRINFDIGQEIPINQMITENATISATIKPKPYYLTITVLSPLLAFEQNFTSFWNVWGPLVTLIVGVLGGGAAGLFFDKIRRSNGRKRNRKNNERLDNYSL
jgi:hypothetical protein